MSDIHLDAVREIAFNYLRKTNRMLLVNDKGDQFFHHFDSKYKVCNVLLIGSDYESIPYKAGYSVTNMGFGLKQNFEDGCLNHPVDVLYIDLTSQYNLSVYLDYAIDDNSLIILKVKAPNDLPEIPEAFKDYKENVFYVGDWNKPHKASSQYYLIMI